MWITTDIIIEIDTRDRQTYGGGGGIINTSEPVPSSRASLGYNFCLTVVALSRPSQPSRHRCCSSRRHTGDREWRPPSNRGRLSMLPPLVSPFLLDRLRVTALSICAKMKSSRKVVNLIFRKRWKVIPWSHRRGRIQTEQNVALQHRMDNSRSVCSRYGGVTDVMRDWNILCFRHQK